MESQRIAVDAVVVLTDCDREAVVAFIRRLYRAGIKDPKRLTFKGLQAMARLRPNKRVLNDGLPGRSAQARAEPGNASPGERGGRDQIGHAYRRLGAGPGSFLLGWLH